MINYLVLPIVQEMESAIEEYVIVKMDIQALFVTKNCVLKIVTVMESVSMEIANVSKDSLDNYVINLILVLVKMEGNV